jgi:hypothetical protein
MSKQTISVNSHIHPAILHGRKVKRKMKDRIEPPKRENYSSTTRYQAAVSKRNLYLQRIATILVMILQQYDRAIAIDRRLRTHPDEEIYHSIRLTRMYCVMAGGGKYVPRSNSSYEMELIPITSTYNDEAKWLVCCFFEQRLRGNNINGCSKWVAKASPKFGPELISIINLIHDVNPSKFAVIRHYLLAEDDEGMTTGEFRFDVADGASQEELEKLSIRLMGEL